MIKRLPDSWTIVTLGELCEGIRGVTYKPDDLVNESTSTTVTLLRSNNIQHGALIYKDVQYVVQEKVNSKQLAEVGDVAVCMSNGSKNLVGKSATFNHIPTGTKYTVGSFCSIFRPLKNISSDFIGHLFSSDQFQKQVDFSLAGSAINNLKNSDLLEYKFLKPPFHEQQKIATILSSVDTVIEKTRAQIDKLKHLKIGMMQQLLTQGIGHTEFKNTPIGRIPKAWKVVTLGKAGSWKGGGTPSKANKEFWSGNIPWVSPKDMKSEFIEKTEDYITEHAITASSTNSIPTGSILIVARSGILKHTLPVAIAAVDVTINQDMKALIVNDKVLALYLFHYLQANNHKVLRATLKAGNTVESLDFSEFSQYQIPLPPVSEQQKIIDVMESIANRLRSKQQLLKSYEQTKKALMQDLLTGKVRVNDDTLTYSH